MKKTGISILALSAIAVSALLGSMSFAASKGAIETKGGVAVTKNDDATILNIEDVSHWQIRTLNIWDISYATYKENGYNYTYWSSDFETFLTQEYGAENSDISTYKQTQTRGWCKNGGGYLLNDGAEWNHQHILPWWVSSFKFQVVNADNWLPDGGYGINGSHGQHSTCNFSFNGSLTLSSMTGGATNDWDAVTIERKVYNPAGVEVGDLDDHQSAKADLYFPDQPVVEGRSFVQWYTNATLTLTYSPVRYTSNTTLYAKYEVTPASLSSYILAQTSGDVSTPECAEKYEKATALYNELSVEQKATFEGSYPEAYARYQNWVAANSVASPVKNISKEGTNVEIIVLSAIAAVALLSFGGALFLRKRKSE